MLKIIYIVGPTASGKSDLAVVMAKKFNGEIINADSRQVYKGFDVGAGKITQKEMRGIQHHLLDVASPRKNFSLGRFLVLADATVQKIIKKGKVPIFVGGTWLYFKAVKEGWVLPDVKPDEKLRKKLEKKSNAELYNILYKLDKRRALTIDKNNKRRLIRAAEIANAIKKIPLLQKATRYDVLALGIDIPLTKLDKKIKQRLYKRILGIITEIKKLRKQLSWKRLISFGLEYDWFSKYLIGKLSLNEATQKALTEIKRFARKQLRTFKKEDVIWIKNEKETMGKVQKFLKNFYS